MTPRVRLPDAFDDVQRAALAKTPHRSDGQWLNLFATLAHRPGLLRRVNALGGYFALDAALPARARELVILRTAHQVGSPYEWAHHRVIAQRLGLTLAEIDSLGDSHLADRWKGAERNLLTAVDELLSTHTLSQPTWDLLGEALDDGQRLELVVLAGFYAMLGGLLNAAGVELEPELGRPQ